MALKFQSKNLTRREQRLLALMTSVLMTAGMWKLAIHPLIASILADWEEITIQEDLKLSNEQKVQQLDSQQHLHETNEKRYRELITPYFAWMESDEIGKFLTSSAVGNGLKVLDLSILMPEQAESVEPYLYSEAEPNTANGLTGGQTLYAAHAEMQIQGDKEKLQAMLDDLVNSGVSIRVESFQWDTTALPEGRHLSKGDMLRISLYIYMVEK